MFSLAKITCRLRNSYQAGYRLNSKLIQSIWAPVSEDVATPFPVYLPCMYVQEDGDGGGKREEWRGQGKINGK